MCESSGDHVELADPKASQRCNPLCMKCGQPAICVVRVNDSMCGPCLHAYLTHKFRSTLGKSHLLTDKEKVLVAFSGGGSSTAMLKLLNQGFEKNVHKKVRFCPHIVHVDEGIVFGLRKEERISSLEKVIGVMQASGFPCLVTSIEQIFQPDESQIVYVDVPNNSNWNQLFNEKLGAKFQEVLVCDDSLTVKEELLEQLRRRLLTAVARRNACRKVLLGSNCTRVVSGLLAGISLGRGAHTTMETAFADDRFGDVVFIRPLREFAAKEIGLFNRVCGVEAVMTHRISSKTDRLGSIQRLTEDFICGLQSSFPSTVSTAFRTADKLSSIANAGTTLCALCQAFVDTDVEASSSLRSTQFSAALMGSSLPEESSLCYSCQRTLRNVLSTHNPEKQVGQELLPELIRQRLSHRSEQTEQQSEPDECN